MKKYIKVTGMIATGAIFAGTLVFLYHKSQTPPAFYEIRQAQVGTIVQTTVSTGKIEPRDEIQIKPQISGIISDIYKQAGDKVQQGEIIAKVKVIPELGQLNAAESRLRLAKINGQQAETDLQRTERLYKDKLISNEEYEKTLLAARQAREELQAATDNLEITKEGITKGNASISSTLIRSTINGLILDIPVKVGNSVIMSNTFNDGTTIATIADMSDLIFKGYVDETEVAQLRTGTTVNITLGALQNKNFKAVLEYISPKSIDNNGANQFEIKAALDVPDSITIYSGYSANAEIELQRACNVVTIPESTVEFQTDSTFVYVLTDSVPAQQFKRQPIITGISNGINIEVKQGLNGNERIRGLKKQQ